MRYRLISLGLVLLFLCFELPFTAIRLSDTNGYILHASRILQGAIVYRDMFFTNAPLFAYISALYLFLVGGSVKLFYITSLIEICITSFFLYKIIEIRTKSPLFSVIGLALYLNSFIVLATSVYQTGIFTVTLFATASYFFFLKKQWILTGVMLALMVLVKGYFLPVALGLGLYSLWKERTGSYLIVLAGSITLFIVMLPTFLFAREEFFNQVFGYTLNRPAGLNKLVITRFFLQAHWVLLLSFVSFFYFWKKVKIELLILAFCSLFLFIFKDVYFFYFNMLMPFVTIAFSVCIKEFVEKVKGEFAVLTMIVILVLHIILSLQLFFSGYTHTGVIFDEHKLVKKVLEEKPDVIYGTPDYTPLLSYQTKIPTLNNMNDANPNLFIAGVYNKKKITEDIFKQRTLVIDYGAEYPQAGIDIKVFGEIVDADQILEKCKLVESVPIISEGHANKLNIFRCY